ncbi:hypothetical protein C7M84_001375 [Penaeus vannamei]|uniref:Uncharacterized protein n=1 Tax=Penaeus vannamei TaxID=6689 RepID=A0A423TTW0_PENVA|nr:hypothetical protein C7M84_001375 [Penaeus vannamei]
MCLHLLTITPPVAAIITIIIPIPCSINSLMHMQILTASLASWSYSLLPWLSPSCSLLSSSALLWLSPPPLIFSRFLHSVHTPALSCSPPFLRPLFSSLLLPLHSSFFILSILLLSLLSPFSSLSLLLLLLFILRSSLFLHTDILFHLSSSIISLFPPPPFSASLLLLHSLGMVLFLSFSLSPPPSIASSLASIHMPFRPILVSSIHRHFSYSWSSLSSPRSPFFPSRIIHSIPPLLSLLPHVLFLPPSLSSLLPPLTLFSLYRSHAPFLVSCLSPLLHPPLIPPFPLVVPLGFASINGFLAGRTTFALPLPVSLAPLAAPYQSVVTALLLHAPSRHCPIPPTTASLPAITGALPPLRHLPLPPTLTALFPTLLASHWRSLPPTHVPLPHPNCPPPLPALRALSLSLFPYPPLLTAPFPPRSQLPQFPLRPSLLANLSSLYCLLLYALTALTLRPSPLLLPLYCPYPPFTAPYARSYARSPLTAPPPLHWPPPPLTARLPSRRLTAPPAHRLLLSRLLTAYLTRLHLPASPLPHCPPSPPHSPCLPLPPRHNLPLPASHCPTPCTAALPVLPTAPRPSHLPLPLNPVSLLAPPSSLPPTPSHCRPLPPPFTAPYGLLTCSALPTHWPPLPLTAPTP